MVSDGKSPRRGPPFQMADHLTPLVRNCWYVGASAAELGRSLLARRLLDTMVVLYRKEDGTPVALENRCIHRSFPLDKGCLVGDNVRCGYHGMVYDPKGQCVEMPSLRRAPPNARVRNFPVREVGPVIWIWLGDADKTDERLIPELPWLASGVWRTIGGNCPVSVNYVAMHENLLDHTHFPVLHGPAVGTPEYMNSELKVWEEGGKVMMSRSLLNSLAPGIYGKITGLSGKMIDRHSDSRFESPAAHIAHARVVDATPDADARTFRINITHLFTPERCNSIHYWWFVSRDFGLEDTETDRFLLEGTNKAFLEDKEALSWIQTVKDEASEPLPELSFGPDRPGMLMRKLLLSLANAEAGERSGAASSATVRAPEGIIHHER